MQPNRQLVNVRVLKGPTCWPNMAAKWRCFRLILFTTWNNSSFHPTSGHSETLFQLSTIQLKPLRARRKPQLLSEVQLGNIRSRDKRSLVQGPGGWSRDKNDRGQVTKGVKLAVWCYDTVCKWRPWPRVALWTIVTTWFVNNKWNCEIMIGHVLLCEQL